MDFKNSKNMKFSKIYAVFAGLILLGGTMSSCQDALDAAPDGYLTLDDIFNDNDLTGAYLNSCYAYIPAGGVNYSYWQRGIVTWSDEAWDSDLAPTLLAWRFYSGDASATSHPVLDNSNYWANYWAAIRKCAVFLTRIDAAKVTVPSDKQRWKAEAHVLRAFYYSEMLRWFGTGLPLLSDPLSLETDFSKLTKESYYQTVQFVIQDCNAALSISDLPWRITTDAEYSRVTKAMAEAIKARIIVYAASPLYNEGQNYWEEAYTTAKQSVQNLKNNGYKLYDQVNYGSVYKQANAYLPDDYAALYNEYFTQNPQYSASPADRETIYFNHASQEGTFNVEGIGAGALKSGANPSQEMVDAYETTDGEPVLDLSSPYTDAQHMVPNYNAANMLYDAADPYANRDPRFYASIYYNGSKRYCFWANTELPSSVENYPGDPGERTRVINTYPQDTYSGWSKDAGSRTLTGYYNRKFLHPFADKTNGIAGAYFKMFRLAEAILNYAEAAAEAGHYPEARAALNEIRSRVNMPDVPTDLTGNDLILRVRNERRVELAFEGFRYYDVRRWADPQGDLSKTDRYVTGIDPARVSDGVFTYTRRAIPYSRSCYQSKYLRLPIPASDAELLEQLTGNKWQNPGW